MYTDEEIRITENINLAYKVTHKYYKKFYGLVEFEEIRSLAFLGLTKAAKTYNLTLNFTFATYAYKCMINEILQYMRNNKKYQKDKLISLSEKITENLEVEDSLPDTFNIEEFIESKIQINLLHTYIKQLPDRLQTIINYKLKGYTMSHIGKLIGFSQPQVCRDYHKALNILRDKFKCWEE